MSRYLILLIASGVCSMNANARGQTCGTLEYDALGGGISSDRSPVLESWALSPCTFDTSVRISHVSWIQFFVGDPWNGLVDWSVWSSRTVEDGCANDETSLLQALDLPAWNEILECLFAGCIYQFDLDVDTVLLRGDYYLAARPVSEEHVWGNSIRERPCQGDKTAFFQSDYFGYPCAVSTNDVLGRDICVAMMVTFEPIVVDCEKLRRLRARTDCRKQKVKAKVRARFAEGTELTLFLDGRRAQTVTIDDRGRAKVKWENADGGEVCIAGCEDRCATAPPCGG